MLRLNHDWTWGRDRCPACEAMENQWVRCPSCQSTAWNSRAARRARQPHLQAPILIGLKGLPLRGFSWPFGLLCASAPGFAGLEQASSPVHEESHPTPYICLFQSFGGSCTACTDRWGHARALEPPAFKVCLRHCRSPAFLFFLKMLSVFPAWKAGRPRCGRWPRAGAGAASACAAGRPSG